MGGLFGGGKTNASTPTRYTQMQLNTSVYGVPMPIVFGTTRIGWNLADYLNFRSFQTPSSSGGKGGVFGGGGKGGPTSYSYTASIVGMLCEGPITGINSSWISQTQTPGTPGFTVFDGTLAQTPWAYLSSNYPDHALTYSDFAYVAAQDYALGTSANLPNINWEVEAILAGSAPGTYGGGGSASGGDADPSLIVPLLLSSEQYGIGFPAERIGDPVNNDESHDIPASGPYTITVSDAANYSFNINIGDGSGDVLSCYTCVAGGPTGTGTYSFDPATGIYTFDAADAGLTVKIRYVSLAPLTNMQNFALASGLWVSPAYDTQTAASSILDDLAACTACEYVWSSGFLTAVPRGTHALSANGYTFTPDTTPIFALDDDDFMANSNAIGGSSSSSDDSVIVSRTRASDQINSIKIEAFDRANQYAPTIVEASDMVLIDAYGRRPGSSQSLHMFCDINAAQTCASLQLQDQYIRNRYSFQLDQRYAMLDPMDLVTLTDPAYPGLTAIPVRILEIQENDEGTFSYGAEEYPGSVGSVPEFNLNIGGGYVQDFDVDPGDAAAPAVFDVPVQGVGTLGLETWLATHSDSSDPNWGGCDVYISTDNTTFARVGRMGGATGDCGAPSRMGTLSATFASGSDPDTSHTLSVDLSESFGELEGGTQADADNAVTICFVDGEYVAYQQATLTSTYNYDIGKHGATAGYLRRGLWGSQISSHSSGALFVRLDNNVFRLPYTAKDVGLTIHIKLVSFNIYGGGFQDISTVTSYSHTIGGPPTVYAPSGLTAHAAIKGIQLTWTNPPDIGIAAVEIWRSASSSFAGASQIADAPAYATSFNDQTVSSNTAYWYWIRLRDIAGNTTAYTPSSGGAGATTSAGQAVTADIADSAITTAKIADGSLTGIKFASGLTPVQVVSSLPVSANEGDTAVLTTDGKLYRYHSGSWTAAVPTVDLTGTISTAQIAAGAVDLTKVASGLTFVQIVSSLPGSGSEGDTVFLTTDGKLYRRHSSAWTAVVPAVDITGQLTDSQLAAIAAAKITGQLTDSQLAAIAAAKITGTIVGTQIGNGEISTAKLAAGAVTTNELAANAVTAAKIGAGEVTTAKLAAGAVTANEIAANTITAAKIASGTITATEISSGTITASKIASGTLTANEIAANTITGGKIAAATLTGSLIAGGTITGSNIDALTITAGNIAANAITSGKIDTDAVTAGTVAAGAINAGSIIVDDILVTGHLTANSITNTSIVENASGDCSMTVSISPDAYIVIVQAVIFTLGGSADVLFDSGTFTPFGAVNGVVLWSHSPSSGSHTYESYSSSGTTVSSSIVVTQLLR